MSITGGQIPWNALPHSVEQHVPESQKGFTLIEVATACIVIGILAAFAIPNYSGAKDKAHSAAMKADLHAIAVAEEQYAAENHGQYLPGTATPESPLSGFTPSRDVTVTVTLTTLNLPGSQMPDWTAVAKHAQSSESCEMQARRKTR